MVRFHVNLLVKKIQGNTDGSENDMNSEDEKALDPGAEVDENEM
jgi:hypothetical protein